MRFNRIILVVIWVFALELCYAQQEENELIIERLVEQLADELGEDYDYEEITERLIHYQKFPIDINKTEGEELKELRFLSPLQIGELLDYRRQTEQFISLYELQAIDGFDLLTVERLLPFVMIGKPQALAALDVKNVFRKGKHDLIMRYGSVIQRSEGYKRKENADMSRYLGTPDRYFIRYRYQEPKHFQFALNMKKDPGEEFFSGRKNYGFDFYSASFYLHDLGKLKRLVLGDYSLQFGQGLSLWSGLSFGKGSLLQNVAKQSVGLRPYTSSNETLFLRGLAATIAYPNLEVTPFVSFRKIDATLSDSAGIFTGIGTSGYHRTSSEIENKNAVNQLLLGMNLQYHFKRLEIGASIHQTSFSKELIPNERLYNRFDFSGKTLTNTSLYYHYTFKGVYFFGEGAHSFQQGFALINGIISSISHDLSLVLSHRYYQKEYAAFYNQGFAESSKASNERGLYTGLIWNPNRRLVWVGYADYFKFPWFRFRVDGPSQGYDLFSQFTYTPSKKTEMFLRYRFRKKQENSSQSQPVHLLEDIRTHQVRAEVRYSWLRSIQFRSRFEVANYEKGFEKNEMGLMFYQDVIYKPMQGAISGNTRVALFNTTSYNSRIYAFENDVLYGYSFPAYANKGMRSYFNVRYRINRKMDVWFRYATFLYTNHAIGSGLDQIEGNMKSDVRLQLRVQI